MMLAPHSDRSLAVATYFTPSNQALLNQAISRPRFRRPAAAAGSDYRAVHLIVSRRKNGTIFVLNRDDMGGFNSSGDQVVPEITSQSSGLWSSPTYFNGLIFLTPSNDNVQT